jgi:hypothetical protein
MRSQMASASVAREPAPRALVRRVLIVGVVAEGADPEGGTAEKGPFRQLAFVPAMLGVRQSEYGYASRGAFAFVPRGVGPPTLL